MDTVNTVLGQDAAADVVEVTTLGDLLVRAVSRAPTAEAVVFPDRRRTYGQLLEGALGAARGLYALGVRRGDHVGLLMANSVEFIELVFGIAFLGAVAVPLNSRFRTRELRYVIDHADLKVLVTSDLVAEHTDLAARLMDAFPELATAEDPTDLGISSAPRLRAVVLLGESSRPGFVDQGTVQWRAADVHPATVEVGRARVRVRDVAMVLYTSGTTAYPKGCVHSHEALVRNGITTGRTRFVLTEADRFWNPLPMFHVGFLVPLIAIVDAGATLLSMTHLDGPTALDLIEGERATWLFPAFPAVTGALLDEPGFAQRDLRSVRMTMCVGPAPTLRRLQEKIPHAVQISTYGSTETGGVITYHLISDTADQRATTCGPPFRGVEVAVESLTGDGPAAHGQLGELLVRGYSILDGYYKDASATAAAIDASGWFHTGDLGRIDENGHVVYQGRLKDMVKVGGENVAAVEVEDLLCEHPGVAVAQVVGVPDERLDEVVAAFVEPRPGIDLTEAEVIAFCTGRIASFKVPRYVRIVTEWPMSATKIQKHRLRERFAAELAGA